MRSRRMLRILGPLAIIPTLLSCGGSKLDGGGMVRPSITPHLQTPRIAFTSNRTGSGGIYLDDPATGALQRVSPAGAYEQDPAISADGTRIAFARYESDGRLHLMTMAVDGSDRQVVTDDPAYNDFGPHWSPGGADLVFTRLDRSTAKQDVYTIHIADKSLARITSYGTARALDWSPDGSRLLFVRYVGGLYDVETIGPDLSGETSLYGMLAWEFVGGDYSPNGAQIVLTYGRGELSPRLDLSYADGSNRHPIVYDTNLLQIGRPSWSPDGRLIVFSGHPAYQTDHLYAITPDGKTDPQRLFSDDGIDQAPDWGPKP